MTTEQTAQQLELAAQILRTGHPFEFGSGTTWNRAFDSTPFDCLKGGYQVRPVLATPPDNRPLHNPDNLDAEKVGAGKRLFLLGEGPNKCVGQQEKWKDGEWVPSGAIFSETITEKNATYRVPLSVPWPEPVDLYAELKAAYAAGKVIQRCNEEGHWLDHILPEDKAPLWFHPAKDLRIKPEEPAFQLPPPPPGMRWHREDGWQEGDLPQKMRPMIEGEFTMEGDECIAKLLESKWRESTNWRDGSRASEVCHYRTRRPLTFTHAGKTWTYHRPGDPMPCDGERRIECVFADNSLWTDGDLCGKDVSWTFTGGRNDIIGWRYAEPQTKIVPLGPEDVPPGSILGRSDQKPHTWHSVQGVFVSTVALRTNRESYSYTELKDENWLINRSIPLTGKWDPTAWTPCHKTIPQNG